MYTFKIYRDNEIQTELNNQETDFKAFKYLLTHQGQSTSWALKWGGWKVEQINEETKEISFW